MAIISHFVIFVFKRLQGFKTLQILLLSPIYYISQIAIG